MTEFKIGTTYSCRSACDHNCVWSYTVIDRTAKTITVTDGEEIHKFKISQKISEYCGAESVFPLGRYSMAPVLRAE